MLVNEVLEAVYADVLFPPPFCSTCVDKFDNAETAELVAEPPGAVADKSGADWSVVAAHVVVFVVGEEAPVIPRLRAEVEAAEARFSCPTSEVGVVATVIKRPLLRERSSPNDTDEDETVF